MQKRNHALDMLGDALGYGFSLFTLARSARWHAASGLVMQTSPTWLAEKFR